MCVADCYFIVNVLDFTVCFTYGDISLSMYINPMLNKRWITLPAIYCRSFGAKAVFWTILKDFEFAVYCFLYKKDKGGTLVFSRVSLCVGYKYVADILNFFHFFVWNSSNFLLGIFIFLKRKLLTMPLWVMLALKNSLIKNVLQFDSNLGRHLWKQYNIP